jgi:hypothetical protein
MEQQDGKVLGRACVLARESAGAMCRRCGSPICIHARAAAHKALEHLWQAMSLVDEHGGKGGEVGALVRMCG